MRIPVLHVMNTARERRVSGSVKKGRGETYIQSQNTARTRANLPAIPLREVIHRKQGRPQLVPVLE